MTTGEIVDLLVGLISEAAKLIGDVHTGIVSPAEAETRIAQGAARLAGDRALEDKEIAAKWPGDETTKPSHSL